MKFRIDAIRMRFVPVNCYVRDVYYGSLFVLTQHHNDPSCQWEQQRAFDSAVSLLRYRWNCLSAHQRLQFLCAIEGPHRAEDVG